MSNITVPIIGWGISLDDLDTAVKKECLDDFRSETEWEELSGFTYVYLDDILESPMECDEASFMVVYPEYPWNITEVKSKLAYQTQLYNEIRSRGWMKDKLSLKKFIALPWGEVIGSVTG